ncbi:MAG: putative pyridoxal 5-phosphate synthase [Ilumatobacteraceae bacterium]|nr:putative pyridoxal 5-phosphate synthase [Ilumatobacteraceae bacterium]
MAANQRSQITMSDEEIATYIKQSRIATMGTIGPDGRPHLVAMWYAVIDGAIWFETKGRAQKVKNLQRDDRITCMIEDGDTYDTLRGVSIEGRGVIIDDPEVLWKVGVSVWERYTGPYTEEVKPFVEFMLNKRVAVRVDVERVRTWDHKKLGMAPMPVGGSTAAFMNQER